MAGYATPEAGPEVLLHLALGCRERTDPCVGVLHDLTIWGVREPALRHRR